MINSAKKKITISMPILILQYATDKSEVANLIYQISLNFYRGRFCRGYNDLKSVYLIICSFVCFVIFLSRPNLLIYLEFYY